MTEQLPPGPPTPSALQTVRWIARPIELLSDCQRRYGDIFTLNFQPIGKIAMCSSPQAIKTLFTADPEHVQRPKDNPLTAVLGSSSTLILNGSEHLRRRKLLLPPFHGERMRAYGELMCEVAGCEVDSWPVGEPFKLHARMQEITLEVIERAVFGVEDEHRRERLSKVIKRLVNSTQSLPAVLVMLRNLGQPQPRGLLRLLTEPIDRELYAEIARRRKEDDLAERSDILSLLLQARDEDGEGLSDQELRDELVTLLLAGHETTATSLAWAVERLLRNPPVLEQLLAELSAGEDDTYLDAVIKETLRSRPVLPAVARKLEGPLELDGFRLPAGSLAGISIYLASRNPEIYPDPYKFRPERFIDGAPDTYSWIPFGGGVRRCIGAAFATFEMKVVLREILTRTHLTAPDPTPERMRRRNVTIVPSHGTTVVAERHLG